MCATRRTGREEPLSGMWIAPLAGLFLLTIVLSLRLLSDPDLGFHLNTGRWIVSHLAVPQWDIATYTVTGHPYIDLHWLFQAIIFLLYRLTGYEGLSITVCILTCLTFFLLGKSLWKSSLPPWIFTPLIFIALLVMEPRFVLRPELFTNVFVLIYLLILDAYYENKGSGLWVLPLIMLLWCNMQALFILGLALAGVYVISLWIRDRRIDFRLVLWTGALVLVCFANPYGLTGILSPFELLTRFGAGNIFHEHIQEFRPLVRVADWKTREYLTLTYYLLSLGAILLTIKKRRVHELLLYGIFGLLSLAAIRNIPLFMIVTLPVTGRALHEMYLRAMQKPAKSSLNQRRFLHRVLRLIPYGILLLSLLLMPRLITNSFYGANSSNNRTGIGLDPCHQPEGAADYLLNGKITGRIMNSLGYGGWLSWKLRQPVFIDARLEVIQEALYEEVVGSWHGELGSLIDKYHPEVIVYNYQKYYPWTPQLLKLSDWHPIYLDGEAVIFSRDAIAQEPSFPDTAVLFARTGIGEQLTEARKKELLTQEPPSVLTAWLRGFYHHTNPRAAGVRNMASFFLQMENYSLAERFFMEALKEIPGETVTSCFALAGIYLQLNEPELAALCYRQILESDPGNVSARQSLAGVQPKPVKDLKKTVNCLNETQAAIHFNNGNLRYKAGDIQGALREYSEAIQLNPSHLKAYLNRGYIEATELKNYNNAITDFNRAISLDPAFSEAYLGRGSSRYQLHDFEGAMKDWKQAEDLGNKQAKELLLKHHH